MNFLHEINGYSFRENTFHSKELKTYFVLGIDKVTLRIILKV